MKDKDMINTILKPEKKQQKSVSVEAVFGDIYLLPKWEKIKNIVLARKSFLMPIKSVNASLHRKFSAKNNLEKYCLRDNNENIIASTDLRVYKDCVYIVNLNISNSSLFEASLNMLLQTAIEKAMYNTTDKLLKINLSFSASLNNRIKKIILNKDFIAEKNQTEYEKSMFGETFVLDISASLYWQNKIKQMHILINK